MNFRNRLTLYEKYTEKILAFLSAGKWIDTKAIFPLTEKMLQVIFH